MKYITRKNVLIFTVALSSIVGLLFFLLPTDWCRNNFLCREIYTNEYLGFFIYLSIAFATATLPCTLLTLLLSERVFNTWKKFALIALPFVLVLTFYVLMGSGGSNFFTMDFTLFFLSLIYGPFFLISLIIIIVSALRKS